jgi:hypothetical protein
MDPGCLQFYSVTFADSDETSVRDACAFTTRTEIVAMCSKCPGFWDRAPVESAASANAVFGEID